MQNLKSLAAEFARPTANLELLAAQAMNAPELLDGLFLGLEAEKAQVKYGCLKVLRMVSERTPVLLYPHFDRLVALLAHENTILKWGVINILGNLAAVDKAARLDDILPRLLEPIRGPVMITAAHCIATAGKIALAKPHLARQMAQALLQAEAANYQTAECRNVALGHAIVSLALFFPLLKERQRILDFVARQLTNRRPAVRKKAAAFLKQHGKRGQKNLGR